MTGKPLSRTDWLRFLAVALLLVEGGIHLQQIEGPLNAVPTINRLFLLNAIGAGSIALLLAGSRGQIAVLAALGGLGMTVGALVSLAITRRGTLFDYSEPTLRTAVAFAGIVELAAVLALSAFIISRLRVAGRPDDHPEGPASAASVAMSRWRSASVSRVRRV